MEKYVIIPDVTCDLSAEIREMIGLEEYLEGYVNIDGKEIKTRLDWQNVSRDEFYKTLGSKKHEVSSAPASPEEYYLLFKKYAEAGYGIISLSLSSKISGTYNIASGAAARVSEEFPECRIAAIDTLRMSGSFGLLVIYACEMRREGKSFDEVVSWIEENKYRAHQMGPIDDLSFIARRGRITKGKAFMGNLVGIKPMGDCNSDGYVTVLAKVKGIKPALAATVGYAKRMARGVEAQHILIMHSDREKYATELAELVKQSIPCRDVLVSDVFSGCGTNIGPGMISIYFMGDPVSENCEPEKAALLEAIAENSK